MNTKMRHVCACAGGLVLLASLLVAGRINGAQAATGACSAATIKGRYGFALHGLVSGSFDGTPQKIGEFFPLAAAGSFSFDGQGNASRALTASFGGAVSPVNDSGPYTVNPDCTGTATFSDGTWNLTISEDGGQIDAINATPGILVEGVLSRSARASH
jgi:hypothetical protein